MKCDCGEHPHTPAECTVHGEDDIRGSFTISTLILGSSNHATTDHSCCCTHGGKCTCALKREPLDSVPELDMAGIATPDTSESSVDQKPRLISTQSDPHITHFAHGYHKALHKHNDAAHKCGKPYKIPRAHTVHGHSKIAQRSFDNLPLTTNKAVEAAKECDLPYQHSVTSAPQSLRLSRSEHGSPAMLPTFISENLPGQVPPLDLSNISTHGFGNGAAGVNYCASPDMEQPLHSAGFDMPFGNSWGAADLPFENSNSTSAMYSQPPSYASFDYSNFSQPGLTNASSGDLSESEDFAQFTRPSPPENHIGSDSSAEDIFRSSRPSSYHGPSALSRQTTVDIDDILASTQAETRAMEQSVTSHPKDSTPPVFHGLSVQDAQKLAHSESPSDSANASQSSLPIITSEPQDQPWALSFNHADPMLSNEMSENVWQS